MAFASRDQIRQARSAGRIDDWEFMKYSTDAAAPVPEAAGQWTWLMTSGGAPGAMANPTTWANTTDFAGSMFNPNRSPGNRYLTGCDIISSQDGTLMVADLLGHIGTGASPNNQLYSTGIKTVTSSALPRSMSTNDLSNVEAWIRLTSATDTTAPIVNLSSYTDQDGNTGAVGGNLTLPATATNAAWMGRLPLAAGDKAVQAVSTFTVGTASASTGLFVLMLLRPLQKIPVLANVATVMQFDSLKRVYDGSSLCLAFMASAASALSVWGTLEMTYDA